MTFPYSQKSMPTVYRGRTYRSRLEAKWAAFFDELRWEYEYEPDDLGNWSPDFAIQAAKKPIYVEVKPVTSPDDETVRRIVLNAGEHLFLGIKPVMRELTFGIQIGWFCQSSPIQDTGTALDAPLVYDASIEAMSPNLFALFSYVGDTRDRITRRYRPDAEHLLKCLPLDFVRDHWGAACDNVQWHKRENARLQAPAP